MDLQYLLDGLNAINENTLLKQLCVVVVYAMLAKLIDLIIDHVLRKLASRTEMTYDDHLIDFVHAPICWTIIGVGILHALLLDPLKVPWDSVLPATVKSAILFSWLFSLMRTLNRLTEENLAKIDAQSKLSTDVILFLKNLMRVVAVIAALLFLLAIWKVNLTPLFASAGIAGIAVALAAKDTLANLFGGISIFMDRTFKVGDYIVLDNESRGEVIEIGIRSTRIKTRDEVMITIPNSIIANSKIINESAPLPRFRLRVPIGIAYDSDLDKVEEVLLAVAALNPDILKNPEPLVRFRKCGASALELELLVWVKDPSRKGLDQHILLKEIHKAFNHYKIVIPFPQMDVHFKNDRNTLE